jgi:hypothetical protein
VRGHDGSLRMRHGDDGRAGDGRMYAACRAMGWYGCDHLEGVVVEVEEGSERGRLWDV